MHTADATKQGSTEEMMLERRDLSENNETIVLPSNDADELVSNGGSCDLNCQNGGKCELLTLSHHHHHTIPKRCMCAPGYGGLECERETSVCFTAFANDYYCQAGAPCLLSRDGQYDYCDCQQAFDLSAFAGLECDFSATEYCTDSSSLSYVAFCANGGDCKTYIQDEEVEGHPGCNCPTKFVGNHCEYLKGEVRDIDNARTNARTSNEPQGNGHRWFNRFTIALLAVSLLTLINMIRSWLKRKHRDNAPLGETITFSMS